MWEGDGFEAFNYTKINVDHLINSVLEMELHIGILNI